MGRPESALRRGGAIQRVCTTPFAEPQGVPPKAELAHYQIVDEFDEIG
jgi:hypothetical protein